MYDLHQLSDHRLLIKNKRFIWKTVKRVYSLLDNNV